MQEAALKSIAHKLPKIGPRAHSIMDYVMAGAFIAAGAIFYRSNKRAALGAALCGAATLAVSALTDYEDRGRRQIQYHSHGGVHTGLAAMSAAMPSLLDFNEESEARFFRATAAAGTVVGMATDYERRKKLK